MKSMCYLKRSSSWPSSPRLGGCRKLPDADMCSCCCCWGLSTTGLKFLFSWILLNNFCCFNTGSSGLVILLPAACKGVDSTRLKEGASLLKQYYRLSEIRSLSSGRVYYLGPFNVIAEAWSSTTMTSSPTVGPVPVPWHAPATKTLSTRVLSLSKCCCMTAQFVSSFVPWSFDIIWWFCSSKWTRMELKSRAWSPRPFTLLKLQTNQN